MQHISICLVGAIDNTVYRDVGAEIRVDNGVNSIVSGLMRNLLVVHQCTHNALLCVCCSKSIISNLQVPTSS